MDRQRRMGFLFAEMTDAGISTEKSKRCNWATCSLGREVDSFTTLTIAEIDILVWVAKYGDRPSDPDFEGYVLCGAPCPDGWPCVVDVGHIERGEDHAREDGIAWAVR